VLEEYDCELDIDESGMNIGGEFERGKPRKLVPDIPSATPIDELNALGEGANGFVL
jgi:hypothetical protein